MALIGLAIAFYPPIFHYGWLLLVLALILGVIALFQKGQTKGTAIAGAVIGAVGLAASLVVVFVYAGTLLWSLFGFTTAPTP